MNEYKFTIKGNPHTKQSVRTKIIQKGKKAFAMHYKDPEVKKNEDNIMQQIKAQLPASFKPFKQPLSMDVTFVFTLPKSAKASIKSSVVSGARHYRDKRPDLVDNLMKGLCDAMNNVVFDDDSRIVEVFSRKIYGTEAKTIVKIKPKKNELTLL